MPSTTQFRQLLLQLFLFGCLAISLTAKAQESAKVYDLDSHNLDAFLLEMIDEFQHFQQEIIDYRRLYDDRGDHRGYMIWRQNAFAPTLRVRSDYYQAMFEQNAALIESNKLTPLFEVFASLDRFSVDVMRGLVEQDADAVQNSRKTFQHNREVINEVAQRRNLTVSDAN